MIIIYYLRLEHDYLNDCLVIQSKIRLPEFEESESERMFNTVYLIRA